MSKKKSRLSRVTLGEIWYWVRFVSSVLAVVFAGLLILAIRPLIMFVAIAPTVTKPELTNLNNLAFGLFWGFVIAEFTWKQLHLESLYHKLDNWMPK